jgi:hypothetical protein
MKEDINQKLETEMNSKYNTLHKKIRSLEKRTPSQQTLKHPSLNE